MQAISASSTGRGASSRLVLILRQVENLAHVVIISLCLLATPPVHGQAAGDWPVLGGNPQRTAQAGGVPVLDPLWKKELTTHTEVRQELRKSEIAMEQRRQPVLPAASPVVTTLMHKGKPMPLALYVTSAGIHAVHLHTGETAWWGRSLGLETAFSRPAMTSAVTGWLSAYRQAQRPGIVFENSLITQPTTDGKAVYTVDDLPFTPPVPNQLMDARNLPGQDDPRLPAPVRSALAGNKLQAFDLRTGKLLWELGTAGDKSDLGESFFLSAPLPLDNRLYVLNEKNADLRLLTLSPQGKVLGTEVLAGAARNLAQDADRRLHAAHLSYANGILVCSTNAGAILGVETATGTLAWAHRYGSGRPAPVGIQGLVPQPTQPAPARSVVWQGSPPLLVDDKVIVSAVDSRTIDCLNLRDGALVWRRPVADTDLYLGGVAGGKLLVVGSSGCRALDLARGNQMWSLFTGQPSGHGVISEGLFYLPLKSWATNGKPEVCAIHIAGGKVQAHIRSRTGLIPGTLVFAQGIMLSMTTHDITAFPERSSRVKRIADRLKEDPKDPLALGERGVLALDQGNLAAAIDDLRGPWR